MLDAHANRTRVKLISKGNKKHTKIKQKKKNEIESRQMNTKT